MGYSTGLRPLARGSFPSRRSRAHGERHKRACRHFQLGGIILWSIHLYPKAAALHCAAAGIDGPCGYLHAVWRFAGATPPGAHAKRLPRCLAKANGGAVFWAESWLSAAPVYPPVPPRPRLPLCAARWRPRAFRPVFCCRPPPRPRAGPLPGAFFPAGRTPLAALCLPRKGSPPQSPSKRAACCWTAFFEAGFTLFLVRPLAALRPHYLLTPPGLRQPAPERRMKTPYGVCTSSGGHAGGLPPAGTGLLRDRPARRRGRAARAPAGTTEPRIRRTRLPHRIYGRTSRKDTPLKRRARFGGVCVRSIF